MAKITDPHYFLPIIEAMEAGKVLTNGRTRPMIVRGICLQTGQKGEYVVKLKGASEMWPSSSLHEITGSFLAMELGLQTPEPAIISISPQLIENMRGRHENYYVAVNSRGYNFGSSLKAPFQELFLGQPLTVEMRDKLCDLFAFDVLIGNPDRRTEKTNFLTNGKDILIFDHEMAFSLTWLHPSARNPTPWLIAPADMGWIKKNFCYQRLKGNSIDFSNFVERLSVLGEKFWAKASQLIPEEWKNEHFEAIIQYISQIVEHRQEFAAELNRILL